MTHTKAELALLPSLILDMLKREPMCSAAEIVQELAFSEGAVRRALSLLRAKDHVYLVTTHTVKPGNKSVAHFWQHGPKPHGQLTPTIADVKRAAPQKRLGARKRNGGILTPHQPIRKEYPAVGVRNEFETYFFGPARKVAA